MSAARAAGAKHRLLVYQDPARFVEGVVPFVRDGLRAGERVLVAVTTEKHGWLREALDGDAGATDVLDAVPLYARYGPMFRTLMEYVRHHDAPGAGVRIIAEQPLGERSPADRRAYLRYEAAANAAYEAHDVAVLCPYDGAGLPDDVLRDAARTHPEVLVDGHAEPNRAYADPRTFVRESVPGRAPPPAAARYAIERAESLAGARRFVRAQATAAGLSAQAVDELALAVTEVATNALVHGAAPRQLWSYLDAGHIVFHVSDAGATVPDPLSGYLPPDPARLGGRGLWLAHQLCDIVETAGDAVRTDVRLLVRIAAAG